MSEYKKILLPKLGESIVSATVVQWFKKVGDVVALDEPLLEVSTDKVNSEIPSPVAGVLQEILVRPEEEVQVGAVLAMIGTQESVAECIAVHSAPPASSSAPMGEFLSPSVVRLLHERGLNLSEIEQIPRSGEGGRLTKKDVERYVCVPSESAATKRVKMTPMRKAIAENMVKSFYEAPHASLITEVDVTQILKEIQTHKHAFLTQHAAKLTITAFVVRAMARALHAYPLLNSSLEGDTIVMKKFINLGIAVSVDQGVMVPVLKNCQDLNLVQISKGVSDLAEKTRSHGLSVDAVRDGTITLTNFGMTGTLIGVPIIRHPEVAIVGLGAITRRVVAMPDDAIAVRSMAFISLTFDHRVLDGIYGCSFLNELKKQLEAHFEATL